MYRTFAPGISLVVIKTWITGLCILYICFTPEISTAQPGHAGEDSSHAATDTAYIADYTNVLTARLFLLFQNASLLVNPVGDKIPKIVYHPNANVRVGIAGFWKWFGLGLSIDNPFYKTDPKAFGKTTAMDLRVNAFGRFFACELFYQQYKGLYISSPEPAVGSHYIIPDMQTIAVGLSGFWIYNGRKFSIRAAFIQNERQKRSAGSIVVRPSFLYSRISSDHGIIPAEISETYHLPTSSLIRNGTFYSLGIAPGYAYTLVLLKNFYITAAVFPGVAAHYYSFNSASDNSTHFDLVFQLSGRFAIGYNSKKWFLGGSYQSGFNDVPDRLNNALFIYDIAQFRFWGGTRFDIFKKKKKTAANH